MINKNLLEKASKVTMTDYSEIKDLRELSEAIIENLLDEIDNLNQKFNDYKQYVGDNFERIKVEKMI